MSERQNTMFVVKSGDYPGLFEPGRCPGYRIRGIFSTREKAQKYIWSLAAASEDAFGVEEWQIDRGSSR